MYVVKVNPFTIVLGVQMFMNCVGASWFVHSFIQILLSHLHSCLLKCGYFLVSFQPCSLHNSLSVPDLTYVHPDVPTVNRDVITYKLHEF
jgi:hypothetical protein